MFDERSERVWRIFGFFFIAFLVLSSFSSSAVGCRDFPILINPLFYLFILFICVGVAKCTTKKVVV